MLAPLPTPLVVTQLHASLRGGAREVYQFDHGNGLVIQCIGHAGIDFAAPVGTQVHAMKGGVLSLAPHDPWSGGYSSGLGLYAVLTLPNGETHLYAHLSTVIPKQGAIVAAGAVFALSGDSGHVQAHLHVAVRPPHPDYQNGLDGTVDFLTHFDHSLYAHIDLSFV